MAKTAFLLGGTGMIGRAVSMRLAEKGWEVTVASRGERPLDDDQREVARHVAVDRTDDGALREALGAGVDVLVDVIPMESRDAEQLVELRGRFGSLVAISSAAVYCDASGRTLSEATGPDDFPILQVPIWERQQTVAPDPATYSTRKAAIERTLLADESLRATVVRPCAIHGPGDRQSREWFFVKRILDGRRAVPLAYRGESRFHTTSVTNLAELVWLAAERPGRRVLNCGDPEPPSVAEIGRAIAAAMGRELAEVLLPGPPVDGVGENPWGVPRPFVVDMSEAELELGYRPVTTYPKAVAKTCEWLVAATEGRDWREVLPNLARQPGDFFDYGAEDAFVTGLTGG
jgi:nucleoside-diphosphate-sugar epimerase